MNWTKEKPKLPGCYAWRDPDNGWINSMLIRVELVDGVLSAFHTTKYKPISDFYDREWLGPLPE